MAALHHLFSNCFSQWTLRELLKIPSWSRNHFPTDNRHKTALELQTKADYDSFYYQPTKVCNVTSK